MIDRRRTASQALYVMGATNLTKVKDRMYSKWYAKTAAIVKPKGGSAVVVVLEDATVSPEEELVDMA
eukprot:CAMPEP_0178743516 /NCGR_PEP_ID=MMETSP0744-20121128/6248_1 /TAXON_ID=913974 /ORGANISM="Nitzschia punctata, Strain CCMP561" /LENGTH=66 /DNA_ID=CAMNT_0020396527 /DNA_START=114 /DNA_END=314 /DNA_ORIENTATION=-